jgi:hypothetical protein
MTESCGSLGFKFILHALDEVFCPSRGSNNSVSDGLAQLVPGGAGMLRDREVFGQSVRAVDRYCAGHPDQFAGFDIEDFGEFIIENLVAGLHRDRLRLI